MRRSAWILPWLVWGCADREKSQHVEYAMRADGPLLGQAVYPPSDIRRTDAPCAVLLHGGGWARGRREDMGEVARRLASHGIVCFSVDYRLAPAHPWPAPLRDAEAAVAWVRANATTLGVDPRRVSAVGVSAGAHLALSLSVRGICPAGSIYGPTDMAPGRMPRIENDVRACVGVDPVTIRDASPALLVRSGSSPAFLIQGDKDVSVPPDHALRFVAAMRAARRPVELRMLPGRGHEFDSYTFDTWAAVDRLAQWLLAQPPTTP